MKLHCCNEFPNECVVSVSRDNPHSSQKKDFYFSSFLILAAHNAQHQFLISASFSITEELANIRQHFAHIFRTFRQNLQFLQQIATCIANVPTERQDDHRATGLISKFCLMLIMINLWQKTGQEFLSDNNAGLTNVHLQAAQNKSGASSKKFHKVAVC